MSEARIDAGTERGNRTFCYVIDEVDATGWRVVSEGVDEVRL